jgi:hypothetical protein
MQRDVLITVVSTVISVVFTWVASWVFYVRAARGLTSEAAKLRTITAAILLNRHNPDLAFSVDETGNASVIAPAKGNA